MENSDKSCSIFYHDLLFENAPVGVLLVYEDGTILAVNKKALSLLGEFSKQEGLGLNLLTYEPFVEVGLSDIVRLFFAGEKVTSNISYETKWGGHVYLKVSGRPVFNPNESGKIYTITLEDAEKDYNLLDEVEKAKHVLEVIIDTIPQAVWVKDFIGRYIIANKQYLYITNKNAVGEFDLVLWGEEVGKQYRDEDAIVMATKTTLILEHNIITNEGSRIFNVTKAPLIGNDGLAWGIVGVVVDITDDVRQKEVIREEIANLQRMVGQNNE